MSYQNWDQRTLQAAAQIAQRALQDAFSRVLKLLHRAPEAYRNLGIRPEEKNRRRRPEQPVGRQDLEEEGESVRPGTPPRIRHPAPFLKPVRFNAGRRCHPDVPPPPEVAGIVAGIVQEFFPMSNDGSCASGKGKVLFTLKEVIKTQSVADIGIYDGTSSFEDFIRRLEVKYPETLWSDEDRKNILLTHLGGTARAAIDTAPELTPNSSYHSIVKALKEARRTPGERLQAEMDWKNLRIKDD
ncbi:unnamed protein product [Heligmosomoides polygyrus]|uniref:Retrotrans_gag domain-containing protein n=1 Tax=Heligmosomoides polygyrus TaxID=6339 RepID=A0A183F831_HELPZ|nr:unnamed protein product [Heligmosomoides polygyrus]